MSTTTRIFAAVTAELDVTPRWYQPGQGGLFEDGAAILGTLAVYEGALHALLLDVQIGVTGVRLITRVPAGNQTDGLEGERCLVKAMLDNLDAAHPRRLRVTKARLEAEEQARAAKEAEEQAKAPPPAQAEAHASQDATPTIAGTAPEGAQDEAA